MEISSSDEFLLSAHLNKIKVPTILIFDYHSSQSDTMSHMKKQSHLKAKFLPAMTLLMSLQNFQTHLESNFLFSLISNITSKGFQNDWSQVNNMQIFTDRHLLIRIN